MIATTRLLPYQSGLVLSKTHLGSTTELCSSSHNWEVLYIQDEGREEEAKANISNDKLSEVGETDQ